MIKLLGTLALLSLVCGCGGKTLDESYDASLYANYKEPNQENLAYHAQLLKEVIDHAEQNGAYPPPGICAEYALYSARTNNNQQSSIYLRKELQYYPESAIFIAVLRKIIEGRDNAGQQHSEKSEENSEKSEQPESSPKTPEQNPEKSEQNSA